MDYEKAYKDALKRAKQVHEYSSDLAEIERMEDIFPELKELDDERIRKALIDFFDDANKCDENPMYEYGIYPEEILAWLEKQGNQREQLINKACDILVNCIEDYMLRRMEVWSEECKNQTLENIRKELEK